MALDLLTSVNVQEGLTELVDKVYSIRQNLNARVETPVLKDGIDLFSAFLDSKTINLYGGINEDKRHRFKIDHNFDLSKIINSDINSNGSISADKYTYTQSQGTEFVIINKKEIKGAKTDYYAIRADKYQNIREQLNKGGYKLEDLEKAGGFKINKRLKPEEISTHDGWKELAVGKNNASNQDYEEASKFLKDGYVPKAQQNKCFRDGIGMSFFVRTNETDYKLRPWSVGDSDYRSDASGMGNFGGSGHFLRVLDKSAEGATEKITPNAIIDYLNRNPVKDGTFAAVLLGSANKFYQAQKQ